MEHCCEEMTFHIHEMEKIMRYFPKFRSYGIKVDESVTQGIIYCPWCGTKLPRDLTSELAHIVFEELKLDDFRDPRLPEEFKTDEWWRKRGL